MHQNNGLVDSIIHTILLCFRSKMIMWFFNNIRRNIIFLFILSGTLDFLTRYKHYTRE